MTNLDPTPNVSAMANLDAIARERFQIPSLHPWQRDAIQAVLSPPGRALVIAPTGGGKSLCYQLPAVLLPGTALIVSPLISLMEDQVRSLEQRGIAATYLASTLSPDERSRRVAQIRRGDYRLVYLAPERLGERIEDFIPLKRLSLFAIDEAHCVVHWGHDFRPDYLRLGALLRREQPERILACTATATPSTRAAILQALGFDEHKTPVIMRGFARPNLALHVHEIDKPREAMDCTHSALQKALGSPSKPNGAGIAYTATRKQAEQLAEFLSSKGWRARAYHAGIASELRSRCAQDFALRKLDIVAATNAFGMGIDRPDVRLVVHAQPPASIEAYYQEVGRAGRDGAPARGLLCIAPVDIPLRRRLIELGSDGAPADSVAVTRAWSLFQELLLYVDARSCRHDFILRYFGDEAESLGGCGQCDVCLDRASDSNDPEATERDTEQVRKTLAAVARARQRGGMMAIMQMLRGERSERVRRFGFDSLSTFGLLRDLTSREVMGILRASIAAGYLGITVGDFPIPFLTPLGARVMRKEERCLIRLRKPPKADTVISKRAPPLSKQEKNIVRKEPSSPTARTRFEALRAARTELAKQLHLPPYVIAHDTALLVAAEAAPTNLEALQELYGWGPAKVARYGEPILRALAEAGKKDALTEPALLTFSNSPGHQLGRNGYGFGLPGRSHPHSSAGSSRRSSVLAWQRL